MRRFPPRRQSEAQLQAEADEMARYQSDVAGPALDFDTNQPREEGGRAGIDVNAGHDSGGTVREIPGVRRLGSDLDYDDPQPDADDDPKFDDRKLPPEEEGRRS